MDNNREKLLRLLTHPDNGERLQQTKDILTVLNYQVNAKRLETHAARFSDTDRVIAELKQRLDTYDTENSDIQRTIAEHIETSLARHSDTHKTVAEQSRHTGEVTDALSKQLYAFKLESKKDRADMGTKLSQLVEDDKEIHAQQRSLIAQTLQHQESINAKLDQVFKRLENLETKQGRVHADFLSSRDPPQSGRLLPVASVIHPGLETDDELPERQNRSCTTTPPPSPRKRRSPLGPENKPGHFANPRRPSWLPKRRDILQSFRKSYRDFKKQYKISRPRNESCFVQRFARCIDGVMAYALQEALLRHFPGIFLKPKATTTYGERPRLHLSYLGRLKWEHVKVIKRIWDKDVYDIGEALSGID
ncbi:hypothetical protein DL765_001358 [Monosporascus sp. GIB2]|nr:hypothetical protein DL765_001358 [Monosporascus sp. GIB2]